MKTNANTTSNQTDNGGNRPAFAKKIGSVRVAVWRNVTEGRTYFNINISRVYRDGETYKESSSLNGLADIACLKESLIHVSAWIARAEEEAVAGEE